MAHSFPTRRSSDLRPDRPGVFVFGSNDYYAPTPRNPAWYLLPDDGRRNTHTPKLPFEDLRAAFTDHGWLDLNNAVGRLEVLGSRLAFAGVDDPHLRLDDLSSVAGPAPADADLRIGVAHAPYLRVLDRFANDGYDVTFAGHTHGDRKSTRLNSSHAITSRMPSSA